MTIVRGDYVRLNNPLLDLPRASVWRVIGTVRGLKLHPANAEAKSVRHFTDGLRFKPDDFDAVTAFNGQWVPVPPKSPAMPADTVPNEALPNIMPGNADAVTTARFTAAAAAGTVAAYSSMLESARKAERQRQKELREALAAKAKADKEAAARAKVEEARKALAARLHADRCLAEATLALVGEVSRLNNGGCERPAESSIATHCDQLQALSRSYGYRIAKPSMIALVVKL